MPKLPINYENACIYEIVCKDVNVTKKYIGSTTNLTQRRRLHKSDCNNINGKCFNLYVYRFIRENGGWQKWNMVLVENVKDCKDKEHLDQRERFYIESLKTELNKNIPTRTQTEYREANKDIISEKNKIYRDKNKEKIAENKKHYYEENKDKIAENKKIYRDKNKEKIAENKKRYYEENKDKIAEYYKIYNEKNKDRIREHCKKNKDIIAENKKRYYKKKTEKLTEQKKLNKVKHHYLVRCS